MNSKSACFKDLVWWRSNGDTRKLTHTTEHEDFFFIA